MLQELENIDIGIHALSLIPVAADNNQTGEIEIPEVNFGVSLFSQKIMLGADLTGIILSRTVGT